MEREPGMAGSPKPCLTLSEMAASLGVSRQAICQRASRADWPYFEETARGGRRRLYPVEHLPVAVALALFRGESAKAAGKCAPVAMPAPDCAPEGLWKWASTRTQKQRGVGRFRAEVIARVEELAREHGLPFVEAARRVAGEKGVSPPRSATGTTEPTAGRAPGCTHRMTARPRNYPFSAEAGVGGSRSRRRPGLSSSPSTWTAAGRRLPIATGGPVRRQGCTAGASCLRSALSGIGSRPTSRRSCESSRALACTTR